MTNGSPAEEMRTGQGEDVHNRPAACSTDKNFTAQESLNALLRTQWKEHTFWKTILFFALLNQCLYASIVMTATIDVNVGLIASAPITATATRFLTRASNLLQDEGVLRNFHFTIRADESAGCGAVSEIGDGALLATKFHYSYNVSAFFGPICANDIELAHRLISAWNAVQFNFWRDYHLDVDLSTIVQTSTMSATNLASNIGTVLLLFGWQKIALITCSSCINNDQVSSAPDGVSAEYWNVVRFHTVRRVLVAQGITILIERNIDVSGRTAQQVAAQLKEVKSHARILVSLMGDSLLSYETYLRALQLAELNTDEFLTILTVNTFTSDNIQMPWDFVNATRKQEMLHLYRRSILMINDYYNFSQLAEFAQRMDLAHLSTPDLMTYVQLYESFWLYAYYLERAFERTADLTVHFNSSFIRELMQMNNTAGPFGSIPLTENGQRLAPYRVLAVDVLNSASIEIVEIFVVATDGHTSYSGAVVASSSADDVDGIAGGGCRRPKYADDDQLWCALLGGRLMMDFKYYFENLPPDTPSCGFIGELCDQRGTIIVVVAIMITICSAFVIFLCFRRVKTGETSQMPWAIPSHSICFVQLDFTGSSNMSIHSIQQQMTANGGQPSVSGDLGIAAGGEPSFRVRQLATIEQGFVIIESFALKEKLTFDKRDMQLLFQMKQAVHDNINPFIGVCIDRASELFLIWRHCFRGTLSDLLFSPRTEGKSAGGADDRPTVVDNNFKGAFVRDIIKGLDFIHTSSIGYHGGLTASQCLIDSHWILKISGFGISRLLFKWRHNGIMNARPGVPLIPNSELHYYAPEVRRSIRTAVQRNKPEDLEFSNDDGQAQDMYSFGAILYEILYKRKIVELEDVVEVSDSMVEDDAGVGIFSQSAEEQLPLYPTFPDGGDVHPDLISLMHKCFSGKIDQRPDANMVRKITDATLKMPGSLVDQMIKNMEQYTNNLENLVREQTGKLEEEQQHAEQILLELLPKSVVDELRLGRRVEPKFYKSVTIMYSDIVGFTSLCSESQPMEVVNLLNGMFKAFDHAISQHRAYKVETIGDAYMVASGVPEKMKTDHVREIASIALLQREFLNDYEIPHRAKQHLHCRWGFNSGSVFTGVVGVTAPRYCVFGTTVTLAAKMENSGQPDRIQMTLKSYQLLSEQFPEFRCLPRGGVRLEGIGTLLTYWLEGREEVITIGAADGETQADANNTAEEEPPEASVEKTSTRLASAFDDGPDSAPIIQNGRV